MQKLFLLFIIFIFSCNSEKKKRVEITQEIVKTDSVIKKEKIEISSVDSIIKNDDSFVQKIETTAPKPKILYSVYVNTKNGLKCRVKPDIKSEEIAKFDFGAKLGVIEETEIPLKIFDNNKHLNGEWIKVILKDFYWREPYTQKIGYVFNGYTIDSIKADFTKLPQYYGTKKHNHITLECKEKKLNLIPIKAIEYENIIEPISKSIDTTENNFTNITPEKIEGSPEKGGYFILKTDKSRIKFSCGKGYSRPCNIYLGYEKNLNSYLIGEYGESVYYSYFLDKNNESIFGLGGAKDDGAVSPYFSPDSKTLITIETADKWESEEYYDFRTIMVFYDISDFKNLDDIKNCSSYINKYWEVENFKWVDNVTIALKMADEYKLNDNGQRLPINFSYYKTRIK